MPGPEFIRIGANVRRYRTRDSQQDDILYAGGAPGGSSYAPLLDRADMMGALGIWVGASAPGTAITYAEWVAGDTGYWGSIEV